MSFCEQKGLDPVVSSDSIAHMENTMVIRHGFKFVGERCIGPVRSTENCVLCGKFLAKTDRLPTVRGFAHVACLLATAVRS